MDPRDGRQRASGARRRRRARAPADGAQAAARAAVRRACAQAAARARRGGRARRGRPTARRRGGGGTPWRTAPAGGSPRGGRPRARSAPRSASISAARVHAHARSGARGRSCRRSRRRRAGAGGARRRRGGRCRRATRSDGVLGLDDRDGVLEEAACGGGWWRSLHRHRGCTRALPMDDSTCRIGRRRWRRRHWPRVAPVLDCDRSSIEAIVASVRQEGVTHAGTRRHEQRWS